MNVKQFGRFSFLCFLLIFCIGINTADAQRSKGKRKKRSSQVDEYFDESGNFASRLWYGGGFNLGLNNNEFAVGINPMIGYKIIDQISVGPAGTIQYYRNSFFDYRSVDFAIGGFARGKVFGNVFVHLQLEHQNTKERIVNSDNRIGREAFLIGGGYSSSGGSLWGFELMLLYDVLESNDQIIPWDIRGGINYNF